MGICQFLFNSNPSNPIVTISLYHKIFLYFFWYLIADIQILNWFILDRFPIVKKMLSSVSDNWKEKLQWQAFIKILKSTKARKSSLQAQAYNKKCRVDYHWKFMKTWITNYASRSHMWAVDEAKPAKHPKAVKHQLSSHTTIYYFI